MGKLVTLKKSLLYAIILFAFSFSLYSQEISNEENTASVEQVVNQTDAFETNLNYFSNENTDVQENSVRRPASLLWTIIQFIFFLALIIIAIYFVMKFFQKKGNFSKSDDDFLRRVSTMNLSPGKSIEIVTLLDKGYILGVTDENINLISEIDDKELLEALNLNFDKKQNTKKPMNFSDVLEMFMAKNTNKTSVYGDYENNLKNVKRNPFNRNRDSE